MDEEELCTVDDVEDERAVCMVALLAGKQRKIILTANEVMSMPMSIGGS